MNRTRTRVEIDDVGTSPTDLAGALVLSAIPVAILLVPALVFAWVVGIDRLVMATAAVVIGLGGSFALGPVIANRVIDTLPPADDPASEALSERVCTLAEENGSESPSVRVVDLDAATLAVVSTRRGPTLIIPTRLAELDDEPFDAMVLHALARHRSRNARFTTAFLTPALVVEVIVLLGIELVSRRDRDDETERPRMFGVADRADRSVPWVVYAVAGTFLLVAVTPLWSALVIGDRLLVGRGRRDIDTHLARAGAGDGLAEALVYSREARGFREWPPALDRLSFVPMGEMATRRVRGTSRQERRIRTARLRSKRQL